MESKKEVCEVIVEGEENIEEIHQPNDTIVEQESKPSEDVVEIVEETIQASEDIVEEYDIQKEIEDRVNMTGIAYVYDGKLLEESKLSITGKQYAIFNQVTGLPFIYNGGIVRYNNKKEADAAIITLVMYTGNDKLTLIDYSQLIGKSLL